VDTEYALKSTDKNVMAGDSPHFLTARLRCKRVEILKLKIYPYQSHVSESPTEATITSSTLTVDYDKGRKRSLGTIIG
jgi:hypothetical protein